MKGRLAVIMSVLALAVSCACGSNSKEQSDTTNQSSETVQDAPKEYKIKVVNVLPHSRKAYTQGLEFHDGKIYESSGEYGTSFIEIREFPSQKSLKRVDMPAEFFAEGLTIFNDTLYLLTWRERIIFKFDPETLEETGRQRIYTEGWGITNDGKSLYMSDGSQYIYEMDPKDLSRKRRIPVTTPNGPVFNINELEWIDGKIWANVYGYDRIVVIDPQTGYIEKSIDCKGLLEKSDIKSTTDVLNGIARDPQTGKIYVTGKNWPKMFEIELL